MLAAALIIGGAVAVTIALQLPDWGSRGARVALLPYQVRARDLAAEARARFDALGAAVREAEVFRAARGDWPTPAELAEKRAPLFGREARPYYDWRFERSGDRVAYLGQQSGGDLLVMLQEPKDPGLHPPGTPQDPSHHVLADGTVIHVSVWMREHREEAVVPESPAEAGWREVRE